MKLKNKFSFDGFFEGREYESKGEERRRLIFAILKKVHVFDLHIIPIKNMKNVVSLT